MPDSTTEQESRSTGTHTHGFKAVLLTLRLLFQNDPPSRTLPCPQPHRVEFLVVATEFARVVVAGCNLGAQGEHQHTDGGQPHEDTPAGREGGQGTGRGGPGAGWDIGVGAREREAAFLQSKPTNG